MKKRIYKLLGIIIIVICLFVIGIYFAFTRPFFIKSYLLPALSSATGTKITAENVSLSDFYTKVKLSDFSIQFNHGIDLKGETASFEYGLWSLFSGEIKIDNLALERAELNIKIEPENQSSGKARVISSEEKTNKKGSGAGQKIDISNLAVKNLSVALEYGSSGQIDPYKLYVNNINLSISKLANNSKAEVIYDFSFKSNRGDLFEVDVRKVNGIINCYLGENLIPEQFRLSSVFDDVSGVSKATRFDNRRLKLDIEFKYLKNNLAINEFIFKDISLNEQKLLDINLKGNLSLNPLIAKVDVSDCLLPSNFLNILGTLYGISFDKTVFNYSGHITYSKKDLLLAGDLNLSDFSLSTPDLKFLEDNSVNINLKSDINYSFPKKEFKANIFNLVVTEKGRNVLELSLLEMLSFGRIDNKIKFKSSGAPAVNLVIDEFDLSIIENVIARYCNIHLLKGSLNSRIEASVDDENGVIKLKGNIDVSKSEGVFNKKQFKDVDLRQNVELNILSSDDITLKKLETILLISSKEAIHFDTNGKFNLNKNSGTVHVGIKRLSAGELNKLHLSFIKNILGVRELSLNGFVQLDYSEGGHDFILKSKLKGDDLSFFEVKDAPFIPLLSGNIELFLIKQQESLTFKKFIANVKTPKGRLGNLAADGKLYMSGSDRSKLNLYSEGIKLKELIAVFNSIAGAFNINLDTINADTDFYLKNIAYGPFLIFDCEASLKIDDGLLNADPIYITMNKSLILGKVVWDFKSEENNYFNIAANASNIDIYPLLNTYNPTAYTNAKGRISSFSTAVEGNGISLKNLEKSFKGHLTATFHDVSIPDNPARYDYIRILFIPIEVIAQISTLFGNINLPIFFTDLIKYSRDIFNRMQNLELVRGNIYLVAENGKINFKQCIFHGTGNPVSWMKFNGSIGFDERVDMNTKVELSDLLMIPLHITGKVSDPKPNLFDLTTFLEEQISRSAGHDLFYLLKIPEITLEKIFYDSDVFFQAVTP